MLKSFLKQGLIVLAVGFACLLPGKPAWAIGTEFTLSGSDLVVDVNTKWIGGHNGGYYPVRIRVRNIGPARQLTFVLRSDHPSNPVAEVSQRIVIEQNQTLNTTLLVPMVDSGSSAQLRVVENGRILKNLTGSISLPDVNYVYNHGGSLLIVQNGVVDGEKYNQAALNQFSRAGSAHPSHGSAYYSPSGEFFQTVNPEGLPENWLAYTSVDIVAMRLETLTKRITPEARNAILNWVETGGNLLIYEIGEDPAASTELNQMLDWNRRAFRDEVWSPANRGAFRHVSLIDPADNSRTIPEDLSTGERWPVSDSTFSVRSLGLGMVVAFRENPFPGTISHWAWLMNTLGESRISWRNRNGLSARQLAPSFMQFLIPGVGGVPVTAFLLLITVFTIVIGPVNYAYFMRKKRLSMLLLTVPLLSLGSSLLLVGYSTVAHGFSIKSRVRSVTFLDQKQGTSISINRVAYYAGVAPSQGLQFGQSTAVYPVWATYEGYESGRVDWSDRQHLTSGWLRPRTRTQFLTVSNQEQRGRVDYKAKGAEALEVSNGLEWEIEMILLVDQQGKAWIGGPVRAGGVADLTPASPDDLTQLRTTVMDKDLALPDGMTLQDMPAAVDPHRYRYSHGYSPYDDLGGDVYSRSFQESTLSKFRQPEAYRSVLRPNSYFVILRAHDDLDIGLQNTRERMSLYTMVGYM
ncbi:hypothetical protein [Rubinisphaera margarita]|uniref:hypothetical protein n=1 Tax=Rubinisphaera margarita TaxID=2909586 RepID=UPI001EE8C129|nr:hypothetical protein [Rubinisphaera margarita]MCG6156922.1 hypothetical protein [Rubinisphaera margarita]